MRRLWRYEAQHCGTAALLLPVLAAAATPVGMVLVGEQWHEMIAVTFVPIVAALPVAGVASSDPAGELQASLPARYPVTVARRLALCVAAVSVGVVLLAAMMAILGLPGAAAALFARTWCASILLVGVAASAGSWLQSGSAASSVVVGGWLTQLLLLERLADGATESVLPLLTGLALLGFALHRAGDSANLIDPSRAQKRLA